MPIRSTRSRPPTPPNDQIVREYELIRPDGRWHRMRFPTRAERVREAAVAVAALLVSLALSAIQALPLIVLIRSAFAAS